MNLSLAHTTLATHQDGTDLAPHSSPRPFLHPVTTLAGTTVTERAPADHPHHLGFGVALPDVSGTSFWGGRTFTPEHGSVLLDNHGHQRHLRTLAQGPDHHTALLSWTDPQERELIAEERTLRALPLDEHTWVLDARTTLRNTSGQDLSIGSPATNGRPGAGYGGLFWRAPLGPRPPAVTGPDDLRGEQALAVPGRHHRPRRPLDPAAAPTHPRPRPLVPTREPVPRNGTGPGLGPATPPTQEGDPSTPPPSGHHRRPPR